MGLPARQILAIGIVSGMISVGLVPGSSFRCLHAQSAEVRLALLALQDTARSLTAVADLKALERSDPGGQAAALRRGLLLLREAELGPNRNAFDVAVRAMEGAIRQTPKWPAVWYAIGLTWQAMWERGFLALESDFKPAGISYFAAANDAFGRALRLDPGFQPAAAALARLLLPLEHASLPKAAVPLLEAAGRRPDVPGEVILILGRLRLADADYSGALAADERCLVLGCDSGLAALDQARALRGLGREAEAISAYWRGLRSLSAETRAAYRNDAALVADPAETAILDTIADAGFPAFIERFWKKRAVRDFRTLDDRLSEHLRRWVHAHRAFPLNLPAEARAGPICLGKGVDQPAGEAMMFDPLRFNNYRSAQREVDDRGVIYLRHGEPIARAFYAPGRVNESWAYELSGRRRILHFVACDTIAGLVKLVSILPLQPALWESRSGLDARYGIMAFRMSIRPLPPEKIFEWDREGREAIRIGTRTDGFARRFASVLAPSFQMFAVGLAPGETPRALIAFAVPLEGLRADSTLSDGSRTYRLHFQFLARDLASDAVRQADTVRSFLVRARPEPTQHLMGYWEVPLHPSTYEARILVVDSLRDAGGGAGRDSMTVPGPDTSLSSSDLAIGQPASDLVWPYRGGRIPLSPLGVFRRGDAVNVFQELAGLIPGRRYGVAIELRRAGARPDRRPVVRIAFEVVAQNPYDIVQRTLGLEEVTKGAYSLTVMVRDQATGDSTVRRTPVTVVDRP